MSAMYWDVVDIWFAHRFWHLEDTDIIQSESESSIAPPQLPSWKSAVQYYFQFQIGKAADSQSIRNQILLE